jgi:hypothetical protein
MPANNEGSPPGETAGSKGAALGGVQMDGAAIAQVRACDVSGLPPPPYPSKTKAGGFKFEVDCERMLQSDTFAIAMPRLRPLLVYLWIESWMQVPAGSLPDNDAVIAARIGMPLPEFEASKDILMRGWWKASDGRLYHPVVTEQVNGMIERKGRKAANQAAYRQRKEELAKVTGHLPVTDLAVDGHSPVTDCTTTNTTTTTNEAEHSPEPKGSSQQPILIPLKDGSEYAVTEAEVNEWTAAYPDKDVLGELRKARAWCVANPTKQKTRRGVTSFLNGWLVRQPRSNGPPSAASVNSYFENVNEKFANYNGPTVSLL